MTTSRIDLAVKGATAVRQAQQGPLIRARQPFKLVSWLARALKAQTPPTCTSRVMELVRVRVTKHALLAIPSSILVKDRVSDQTNS